MSTTVSYVCPACGRSSDEATVTKDYTPTANDLKLRPDIGKERNERLTCPCGQVYNWFSARQVTFRNRT